MENQTGLDNQKFQPTEQDIVVQATQVAKSWKRGHWFIPFGILAVILVIGSLVVFMIINQRTLQPQGIQQTSKTETQIPLQSYIADYKIFLNYEEKINDNIYTNGIYLLTPSNPPPRKILDNPDYQTENNSQFGALKFTSSGEYLGFIRAGRQKGNSFEYGEVRDSAISNIKIVEGGWSEYLENFSWSPDGSRFAFLERIGNGPEYSYSVRIFDTKTKNQITQFQLASPAQQHSVNFSWSDNDKLRAVFVVGYTPTEGYKVVSYSDNGTKEFEKIIYSVESNSFRPIFDISQDGQNIAFVKKFQTGNNYRGELWYGNFDGSNVRKLADTNIENCTNASPVALSPNKNLIIVGSGCADNVKAKIINTDNGIGLVTDVDVMSAQWSADGRFVWVAESLYSGSIPSSQNNYILDNQGAVVKRFNFYSSWAAWFPR